MSTETRKYQKHNDKLHKAQDKTKKQHRIVKEKAKMKLLKKKVTHEARPEEK
jgi:hypothetical protein